ncbi:PKD domain-containing protein [Porticoccaceae bacterium]|nr:PKD domain-containing protein [Porticoccaceae bacterium]
MKNFSDYRLLPLIFSLVLTACGGGGGGGGNTFNPVPTAPPANSAPSANAGADQQVLASEEVNLSGSGSDSDGSIASYLWTQTSGETVTLVSDDTASTSFTAPAVETRLEFELRVTDDDGAEATDSVSVSVSLPANNSPTADAGVNQTVAISTQVILNGTATDSDGSIASYSWAQTSGETVILTDADTATATFTTPDIGGLLEFSLTVADNQGATATDSVTINVSDEKVSVSGIITFDLVPFAASRIGLDYSNIQQAPARGLVVEAVDESSNVLLSNLTDSQGRYDLRVDSNTSMRVRVLAKLLQTTGVTWDVKVTDNTLSNALYAVQGDLFNAGSTDSNINFNMPSGWDGSSYSSSRTAAPFAILDALYDTLQKFAAVDSNLDFPALEVRWSEKNNPADGNLTDGDIGTSFYFGGKIYILGAADTDSDEYDRHVVIHEWGHYFEDQLSRTDSIGGGHSLSEQLDMRVAFGEGWGNALSAMITDDPFYRDSSGLDQGNGFEFSVERNTYTGTGWFNEGSVQSVLYDIYDSGDDGADSLSLGLGPIYNTLTDSVYSAGTYFTSIFSFTDHLKTLEPSAADQLVSLLSGQTISGTGPNGLNETNDGDIASALPVYKVANVGGSAIQLCSVDDAGYYNKLGTQSFVEFQIPAAGTYNFSVTEVGGATASDPDFYIYQSGIRLHVAESGVIGSENASLNFETTGTHVLVFNDWNNIDETDDAGDYCFDFQISN